MKISDSISVSGTSVRSRIDEISHRLGVIKRSESSLAAERISLLTELKTLRFVNAEATLTGDGHLSRREARETMIHSTVVDALPIFGEALAGGTITVAHLESMSRALKIMGDNKDLLLNQAHSLILAATHMPADDFDSDTTELLAAGVNPKIVRERLWRSNVSTTLNIYSHVTPTIQQNAIEQLMNSFPTEAYADA